MASATSKQEGEEEIEEGEGEEREEQEGVEEAATAKRCAVRCRITGEHEPEQWIVTLKIKEKFNSAFLTVHYSRPQWQQFKGPALHSNSCCVFATWCLNFSKLDIPKNLGPTRILSRCSISLTNEECIAGTIVSTDFKEDATSIKETGFTSPPPPAPISPIARIKLH